MKIKNSSENGNVELSINNRNIYSQISQSVNRDWTENTRSRNTHSEYIPNNNTQINTIDSFKVPDYRDCEVTESNALVCNKHYQINNNASETVDNYMTDLDFRSQENISTAVSSAEKFPHDDVKSIGHEIKRTELVDNVPRGIVNPNYPGFQHLAHTLQDYSSRIENFYNSDNEMTDDDIDLELGADVNIDSEDPDVTTNLEFTNLNNNINVEEYNLKNINHSKNGINNETKLDIPDLLKSLTTESDALFYELGADADVENNFNKRNIIGDFNKEIEDEIKCVLNYNINLQNDLAELKRDIQDNFSKPIENTINNISDVVNHVIRKLVETQNIHEIDLNTDTTTEIINVADQPQNLCTDMIVSRPTFLHIKNNLNDRLSDAFLSDGTDEINTDEKDYNDESHSSENLANTIKELNNEPHNVPTTIERLDKENIEVESQNVNVNRTDGNSNQISPPIFNYNAIEYETKRKSKPKRQCEQSKLDSRRNGAGSSSGRNLVSIRNSDPNDSDILESFDVYNIETALPKLDLDALESHLRSAKEAERRKRNDREEIRKRLAMGAECDDYYSMGHFDRIEKKPSLQSRLQSGRNLQICFMNDAASDNESQLSEFDKPFDKKLSKTSIFSKSNYNLSNHPYQTRPLSVNISKQEKISTLQSGAKLKPTVLSSRGKSRSVQSLGPIDVKESDFYALQATLQTEARIALAQAKEMARIQMERERRSRPLSPVTEMLRRAMQKANAPLAADRRRVSRHLLTDMNVAQLQVVVNELHGEIEGLNERLVSLLMARDELHMGQDSMLVDIEDLTRYLGVKEQSKKTKGKSVVRKFTSLVQNK